MQEAQAACPLLGSALKEIVKCSRVFATKVVEANASSAGPGHSQHASLASAAPPPLQGDDAELKDGGVQEFKMRMPEEIVEVEQSPAQVAAQLALVRRQWIASSNDVNLPGALNSGLSGTRKDPPNFRQRKSDMYMDGVQHTSAIA